MLFSRLIQKRENTKNSILFMLDRFTEMAWWTKNKNARKNVFSVENLVPKRQTQRQSSFDKSHLSSER